MDKVAAGFFSFTEITEPAEHRAYNEWHQLDHLPEQFPLPGIVFGQRWVSTPELRQRRVVSAPPLDGVHYMTLYLMAEPLLGTMADFRALAERMREEGRFHQHRRARLTGLFQVATTMAAPRIRVSAAAVPYRPNRGVYVIVERCAGSRDPGAQEHELEEFCEVHGVAGAWSFTPPDPEELSPWRSGDLCITVCWLDADVPGTADRLGQIVTRRPPEALLAGGFQTIVAGEWDWFESPVDHPRG